MHVSLRSEGKCEQEVLPWVCLLKWDAGKRYCRSFLSDSWARSCSIKGCSPLLHLLVSLVEVCDPLGKTGDIAVWDMYSEFIHSLIHSSIYLFIYSLTVMKVLKLKNSSPEPGPPSGLRWSPVGFVYFCTYGLLLLHCVAQPESS